MSAIVRRNERSWAISLISDVNIKLRSSNLKIVRAGGESTISTGQKSMFPDVLLYGDDNQTQILQGWELKLPDTSITDVTFINDAKRKAVSLGLNSFFIWNFSAGVLYVKNERSEFEITKQWNETNFIRTRDDVQTYKKDWLRIIGTILLDLNEYLVTGKIRGAEISVIISDAIFASIIDRNKALVSNELKSFSSRNSVVEAYISQWWLNIQGEFVSDEISMFDAYAKVVLLHWINRIEFAHLIKFNHNAAFEVNNLSFDATISEANEVFKRITSSCDFYNIFSDLEYNFILPKEAWHDIMDLNIFLTNSGVQKIDQAALHTILERTVAVSQREVNGQFTTPSILADILVRITTHDWTSEAIDPCCGTGSIPKMILKHKKNHLKDVQKAVETTWASDKFSFPLQIANISLTGIDTINIASRIFQKNIFLLNHGECIQVINPANGEKLDFIVPKFDTVISNLPFVPFEKISNDDWTYINKIQNEVKRNTGVTLNNRNDYYSYIIFALYNILNENGRVGIITSNSWLGTASGREFFTALNYYYYVEQIHVSNTLRWFNNANVVTVISILRKREVISAAQHNEVTSFCLWQKNLKELINEEVYIEKLVNSALLNRELDSKVMSLKKYKKSEITSICEMNVSLSSLFHNITWLLEIRDKLIPIYDVFEVVRGERRGWDEMFYPEFGHNIEHSYIRKVLKNSRNINNLIATADNDAFCCSKNIDELESLNHTGALSWIRRFENNVNQVGKPLHEVLSRSNLKWYEMSNSNTVDIVTTMNPGQRLFYAKFEERSFINQRLIGLIAKDSSIDILLNHALLNSIIGMFFIEAVGFGRGLGALDINSNAIRNALTLNPHLINKQQRDLILTKFQPLIYREVYNTEKEINEVDRIDFDYQVLKIYGIEHYYNEIKDSLISMQKMRLGVTV